MSYLSTRCCHVSIFLYFIAVLPAVHATDVIAGSFQSHKSIFDAARKQVEKPFSAQELKDIKLKFGKLDPRLKLKQCNIPLQGFTTGRQRKTGRMTVGVRCADRKPWSMNVPVTISQFKQVIVATDNLQRGEKLMRNNIRLESRDVASMPYGYLDDMDDSIGLEVKRRINAGTSITPSMVKKPKIISRGQKITILAMAGAMQVRMSGKALANGAVGDRISVMNTSTKRKLEGVVAKDGTVRVDI